MIEMEQLLSRHETPPPSMSMVESIGHSTYGTAADDVSLSSTSTSAFGESLQTVRSANPAESYSISSSAGDTSSAASSIEFYYSSPKNKTETPDQGISLNASVSELDSSLSRPPTTATAPNDSNTIIDQIVLTMIKTAEELTSLADCNTLSSKSSSRTTPSQKPTHSKEDEEVRSQSGFSGIREPSDDPNKAALEELYPISSEVDSLLKDFDTTLTTPSNRTIPKFSQMDDSYTTNRYVSLVRDYKSKSEIKNAALIRTNSWAANLSSHSLPLPAKSVPTTPVFSRFRIKNNSMKIRPDTGNRAKLSATKIHDGDPYFSHYDGASTQPSSPAESRRSYFSPPKLNDSPRLRPVGFTLHHPTAENSAASLTRCDEAGTTTRTSNALVMRNPALLDGSATLPALSKFYDLPQREFPLLDPGTPQSVTTIEELFDRSSDNVCANLNAEKMQILHEVALEELSKYLSRSVGPGARLRDWSGKFELVRTLRNKFSRSPPLQSELGNKLFGVPLHLIQAQNGGGCPLPRIVLDMMDFIKANCAEGVGVFRRGGSRKRIQEMREICDTLTCHDPLPEDFKNIEQLNDLCDLLKLYFRSLPHKLVSESLSDLVISVLLNSQKVKSHFDILELMVLIIPDENREALLIMLEFLATIAEFSETNHMNAQNLATCIMPSIFGIAEITPQPASRRRKTLTGSSPADIQSKNFICMKNSLTIMIERHAELGIIPPKLLAEVALRSADAKKKRESRDALRPMLDLRDFASLNCFIAQLSQELDDNWKGWSSETVHDSDMLVSTREVGDLCSLKSYRVQFTVPATPPQVVGGVLSRRAVWDPLIEMVRPSFIDVDNKEDVTYLTYRPDTNGVNKRAITARIWNENQAGTSRAYVAEKSCKTDPNAINVQIYHSAFLIYPENGKSVVNYVSRIDYKGKSVSWYDKTYKHIIVSQMKRFAELF